MKEMDDIEQLFSDAFSGEEITPPREVKENIDKALFPGEKKRGILYRLTWLLLLLLGLGIGFGGYKYMRNQSGQNNVKITGNVASDEDQLRSKQKEITGDEEFIPSAHSPAKEDFGSESDGVLIAEDPSNFIDVLNDKDEKNDATQNANDISAKPDQGDLNAVEASSVKLTKHSLELFETSTIPELKRVEILPPPKYRVPLTFSVYTGVSHGTSRYRSLSQASNEMDVSAREHLGFNASVEIEYPFRRNIAVSGGVELRLNNDEFYDTTQTITTTFEGYDTVYVYNNPSQQDTIIDTLYNPVYSENITVETSSTLIRTTMIAIPLYLRYEKRIGAYWSVASSVGIRASYSSYRLLTNELNMNKENFRQYGLSVMFRPEINYHFTQFGIGLYAKVGYDLLNGLSTNDSRIRRIEYGSGIRLKYQF